MRSVGLEENRARGLSFGETLARHSRVQPNKIAMIYGDQKFTYSEINARVNSLANALLDMGVKYGDKVAVFFRNNNRILESYYAIAKLGAIAVPLNYRFVGPELHYIIDNADAMTLIYQEDFISTIQGIRKDLKQVRNYICAGSQIPEKDHSYEGLISKYPSVEPPIYVKDDDVAFMLYTSGTTGKPKGVIWTHKGIFVHSAAVSVGLGARRSDIMLNTLPLFHSILTPTTAFIWLGATVVPIDFHPKLAMETIMKHKITACIMVPVMSKMILDLPAVDQYDTSSLRIYGMGADTTPPDIIKKLMKLFPNTTVIDIMGITEMYPIPGCMDGSWFEKPEDRMNKIGSIGKPNIGVEMRVVDDDSKEVPIGSVGEMSYRGITVMEGYYKNPEANKKAFVDGWFRSGDMARKDEEGFFYIVDRKNDMVISGGENIYPREIENVLFKDARILDAAVIGLPDEKWGQAVKALIVLKEGQSMSEKDVVDLCGKHLASYKRPRSVDFVKAIPRNPSGKVLKKEIIDSYVKK